MRRALSSWQTGNPSNADIGSQLRVAQCDKQGVVRFRPGAASPPQWPSGPIDDFDRQVFELHRHGHSSERFPLLCPDKAGVVAEDCFQLGISLSSQLIPVAQVG